MGCPGEYYLGTRFLLVLVDGDEVGKGLERVSRGTLHGEYRFAAVTDELRENVLGIVGLAVLQAGKGAHADEVAVGCHHGDGLQQVFALVAVHDHAALRFQFPRALVHIEHHYVEAQVASGLLGGQAGAQRVVEEDEQRGAMAAQVFVAVTVLFDFCCFLQGFVERSEVGNMKK